MTAMTIVITLIPMTTRVRTMNHPAEATLVLVPIPERRRKVVGMMMMNDYHGSSPPS